MVITGSAGLLAAGAQALASSEWAEAKEAFEAALALEETAEAHDGLGRAHWWLGEVEPAIRHRERAFGLYARTEEVERAVRTAAWLAREHLASLGDDAVANGWLARAERLVDEGLLAAGRGWLELVRAECTAKLSDAERLAEDALRLARRFGDPDLEVAALARLGLIRVQLGRAEEGLSLLDEAMAAATAEASSLEALAEACCGMVEACDLAQDEARNALRSGRPIAARYEGVCRAPAEVVYDLLADLRSHLEWGGERQRSTFRLLTMEAPDAPAGVGTEFRTTGADPGGTWEDTSVVTEATRPSAFEFVTQARFRPKRGSPTEGTIVHRYELAVTADGCRVTHVLRITRLSDVSGMMRLLLVPGVRRLVMKVSAAYDRRGLRNLIAIAEERAVDDRAGKEGSR